MKEDYKTIVNHYGINNQLRKLSEEVFELQEASTLFEYGEGCIEKIIEEAGDVLNVLGTILAYYEIEDDELLKSQKPKVERQLQRIEIDKQGRSVKR